MKKVPATATKDAESVGLLINLLSKTGFLLPEIRHTDTYPVDDGRVIVLATDKSLMGHIMVQVKTLNPAGKLQQSIDTNTLNYAATQSTTPFILIFVDNKNNLAYWLHLDNAYVSMLQISPDQKSKSISIEENNIISKENTAYVEKWRTLLTERIIILDNNRQLYKSFIEISNKSNVLIGEQNKFISRINIFLWEYHKLVDNKFEIVRNALYPGTWRLGIAYTVFSEKEVFFAPYRIPLEKNDVQIKKIGEKEMSEYMYKDGIHGYSQENPIYDHPDFFARVWLKKDLDLIVRQKLLTYPFTHQLAQEFLFAFVDRYRTQMGVENKSMYNISELEFAFNTFLPIWTREVMDFLVKTRRDRVDTKEQLMTRGGYYNANALKSYLRPEELKEINKKVKKTVSKPIEESYQLVLGDTSMAMQLFPQAITYCKNEGMDNIRRVYANNIRRFIFENNVDVCRAHLNQIYKSVYANYEAILKRNFPHAWEDLTILKDIDLVVIKFKFGSRVERGIVSIKYLSAVNRNENTIVKILDEESNDPIFSIGWNEKLDFEGNSYRLISFVDSVVDALFSDTPQADLIYNFLRDGIEGYFRRKP